MITGVLYLSLSTQNLSAESSAAAAVNENPACQNSAGQAQQGQYCNSAQSASQGSDADSALWKVWGGVATICTTACVNSYAVGANATLQAHCKWDNRAGAGTDAAVTKNYSSALQSIAVSEGTVEAQKLMTKNSTSNSTSNGTPSGPKAPKKGDSCMTAISATSSALSKFKSMKNEDHTTQSSLAAAQSLSNTSGNAGVTAVGGPALGVYAGEQSGATAGTAYSGSGASAESGTAGAAHLNNNPCAVARSTGMVTATIRCAIASDPTLPSYVSTPQFLNDFKAASGNDFSHFGSEPNQNAADAISQATAGTLRSSTSSQIAGLIHGLDDHVTAYSSNAGSTALEGAAPADEASSMTEASLAEMMKTMMSPGGLGQNQAASAGQNPTGVQAVIFANQDRLPASIPEDKTLSIFDRITYRYYFVNKQMENSR